MTDEKDTQRSSGKHRRLCDRFESTRDATIIITGRETAPPSGTYALTTTTTMSTDTPTDSTDADHCDCGGRLRSATDRLAGECYFCRRDEPRPEPSDDWRDDDA